MTALAWPSAVAVVTSFAANVHLLFVLPLLVRHDLRWALTIVPITACSYSMYAVIHEAIHGRLGRRSVNEQIGRLLSVLFGSPFVFLKITHAMHHQYNRTIGHPDLFDPLKETRLRACMRYYPELLGGLYVQEVMVALLFSLPSKNLQALAASNSPSSFMGILYGKLLRTYNLRQMRVDGAWIAIVWAVSAILYGKYMWVLGLIVLGRAFVISAIDNVYHYGTSVTPVRYGMNLKLPDAVSLLFLRFNYHGVHHIDPTLPWYALPRAFRELDAGWSAPFGRSFLRQFAGPNPAPPSSNDEEVRS